MSREEVSARLAARNAEVPQLVNAHLEAARAVEAARAAVEAAEDALAKAVRDEETAAQEIGVYVDSAIISEVCLPAVRGFHNWAERCRTILATDPENQGVRDFLARLEGQLLDALDVPAKIDHASLEREFNSLVGVAV